MKNNKLFKYLSTTPVIIYSISLILIPLLYILFLSFLTNDAYGGVEYKFTLSNYLTVFDYTYLKILFKSSLIALITTLICIIISYPFSIFLMDKSEKTRNFLIKMVMIPFLTNSLIRTYGWIVILRKNGVINTFLTSTNIIKNPLSLMYNSFGIIIGMVYTLLPFMILPIYSSVSKIDRSLIEAAKDLGASKWQVFKNIY